MIKGHTKFIDIYLLPILCCFVSLPPRRRFRTATAIVQELYIGNIGKKRRWIEIDQRRDGKNLLGNLLPIPFVCRPRLLACAHTCDLNMLHNSILTAATAAGVQWSQWNEVLVLIGEEKYSKEKMFLSHHYGPPACARVAIDFQLFRSSSYRDGESCVVL